MDSHFDSAVRSLIEAQGHFQAEGHLAFAKKARELAEEVERDCPEARGAIGRALRAVMQERL